MLNEVELRKLSKNLISDPDDYMHSFRENIRMYIDQKEITIAEIAELADMPESTLKTFVYNGGQDCRLSTAIKLAKVFHVSIDELVGSGTISKQTCESLQIMRQLPVSFTHFVRYATHLHYKKLTEGEITDKAIEIMKPEIDGSGGMVMTNDFEILDISNLSEEIRYKTFMGVRIPSNLYEPKYFEGDIMLLANDRKPRDGEYVIASVGNNIYVLKVKNEIVDGAYKIMYYSVRDNKIRSTEDRLKLILGYVTKVIPSGL